MANPARGGTSLEIILPVAGLGTRLRPQTWSKPKPLVSVAGKPMLAHVLDRLLPLQPERLVFITGFLGDKIEAWARENYDLPLAFVEQPVMRGQTDAVNYTRDLVSGDALILFPDMLFEADFSILAETDADIVAFTKEIDDPSAFGVAVIEDGRIVRLVEKPQEPVSNLAVVGIYYFRDMAQLFSAIEDQMERGITLKNEYFLADAIQIMIDRGLKAVSAPVTVWEDCGSAENLLSTNKYLLNHQPPAVADRTDSVIISPSFVAPDAVIERAVIGPHASIGAGATVRDAIVRDAIVEDGATIDTTVVEHSIIGARARVTGQARRLQISDDSAVGPS
jgi:glucose-1-phosphate thymidylyltransferase